MWYVIWTTTGKEEQCRHMIQRNCDSSTYERCVVAFVQRKKRENGAWVTKIEKFAPSYVFLKSHTIELFASELSKIIGFTMLLQNDNLFLPLYPQEEKLLERLLGDGDTIAESYGVKIGQTIQVTEGPLQGMEGMIKYIDRHKRLAVVEMELFDRKVEMKLALEVVTADVGKDKLETGSE